MSDRRSLVLAKKAIYAIAARTARTLGRLVSVGHLGTLVADEVRRRSWQRHHAIEIPSSRLTFHMPSELTRWRAVTLLSKEPGTLEWIDQMSDHSVLWDVGANVGMYTVYAAHTRGIQVVACEPSVFNLEALVRNLNANDLTRLVTVVPLPLGSGVGRATLDYSSTEIGGAFVGMQSVPGLAATRLTHTTNCITIDALVADFGCPAPTHLKIDVDGAEGEILKGAVETLNSVRQVLVEISEDAEGEAIRSALRGAGLAFLRRDTSPLATDPRYRSAGNELWIRRTD